MCSYEQMQVKAISSLLLLLLLLQLKDRPYQQAAKQRLHHVTLGHRYFSHSDQHRNVTSTSTETSPDNAMTLDVVEGLLVQHGQTAAGRVEQCGG